MGRWGKEIEPETFAENSGPKTLDLNRGAGRRLVGKEDEDRNSIVAGRSGWGQQMHSLKAGGDGQKKWVICGDGNAACGWLGHTGL